MQPHYDWQKGQEAWEEIEASRQDPKQVPDPSRLKQRRLLLAVILIIGLVGASVFWVLDRRAQNNTAAVEADILRTNSLVYQAVNQGDIELLRSNLSGRDLGWQLGVEAAAKAGVFYDRSFWGLQVESDLPDVSEVEIELSPEWNAAKLSVLILYETIEGGEAVQLKQTLVYRRSREKWLLAPPDISFWGQYRLFEGEYLAITYPERDSEIVQRLAADLDRMIGEICSLLEDVVCAEDFGVGIRFFNDSPDFSSNAAGIKVLPCSRASQELPTPTLIGLPIDDEGYEALLNGYRSEVAAMAVGKLIYEPACPTSLVTIAMLDYRLSQLGFINWPLRQDDYIKLERDLVHLVQVNAHLRSGQFGFGSGEFRGDWRPFYALVEFLVAEDESILVDMERDFNNNPVVLNGYWPVLYRWTDQIYESNGDMEAAWRAFLIEKGRGETADVVDLPEQNLRLICRRPGVDVVVASLYELALREQLWVPYLTLEHTDGYLLGLPGDDELIVAEQRLSSVSTNNRVLYFGVNDPVVLFESAINLLPVSSSINEAGEETFLIYNRRDREYWSIDLTTCLDSSTCEMEFFPGFPLLSPSGERFMLLITAGSHGYERQFVRTFSLGQLSGEVVGTGRSQFWMRENQLGFVGEDGRTVMNVRVGDDNVSDEAEVLFSLEEVDPFLALDEGATIESVVSNPKDPLDLIVTVKDSEGWASIYQVNILRRWIQPLEDRAFSLDTEAIYSFDFSPEARWLMVSGNDLTTSTAYVHLFDFDENETHSFDYKMAFERPMHWELDWSAGDEWLALPDNGYIRLINPEVEYQDVVVPEGIACSGAVWVNE